MERKRTHRTQLTPATQQEIAAALHVNGMNDLDATPPGTRIFRGWGEVIAELQRGIAAGREDSDQGSAQHNEECEL